MDSFSKVDFRRYERALQFVGSLSGLFSENETPLIDSRVVEKLFCHLTSSYDKSRLDVSFDAVTGAGTGVGIKTYGLSSARASKKSEKIAEFTRDAREGVFSGLPASQLAREVSRLRNARLYSDAAELGISLEGAFYHSLVRVPGAAFINEVALQPIDLSALRPLNHQGVVQPGFDSGVTTNVTFTDGNAQYSFSRSKNVLFRKFDLTQGHNSDLIPLAPMPRIWDQLIDGTLQLIGQDSDSDSADSERLGKESFVVLPLYSTRPGLKKAVPPKSGINQWNAGGRKRSFGEAYIPIPRQVHEISPGFLPPQDRKFKLLLPSGAVVDAKVCQQGSKALMSDPNTILCDWLFSVIDGDRDKSHSRIRAEKPYTYDDLARVGKDSVILRTSTRSGIDFELASAPVDAYEAWVDEMVAE